MPTTINVSVQHPSGLKQGSAEAQSFRLEGPNHLYVDGQCGRAIAEVVANDGSLHQHFDLEADGTTYRGCRVVGRGREFKIMFLTSE